MTFISLYKSLWSWFSNGSRIWLSYLFNMYMRTLTLCTHHRGHPMYSCTRTNVPIENTKSMFGLDKNRRHTDWIELLSLSLLPFHLLQHSRDSQISDHVFCRKLNRILCCGGVVGQDVLLPPMQSNHHNLHHLHHWSFMSPLQPRLPRRIHRSQP